jgi:hypothetical protein
MSTAIDRISVQVWTPIHEGPFEIDVPAMAPVGTQDVRAAIRRAFWHVVALAESDATRAGVEPPELDTIEVAAPGHGVERESYAELFGVSPANRAIGY